ncbi:MAG: S-methyl-5-thioribose-1-phosphate isomerase [Abitibacteriaceae bacterium]|nr:S-methyl-5-thioribose-1-phosphate isomerase [Abditibacteriaceae bacterium]
MVAPTLKQELLQPVAWHKGKVRLLDQTLLPGEVRYVELDNWREVVTAIRTMIVRGAPAIGCTAALGLALGAQGIETTDCTEFLTQLGIIADALRGARPTAVNLFWAIDRVWGVAAQHQGSSTEMKAAILAEATAMVEADIATNRCLGLHGASLLPEQATVLTHCNAGALATAGYGTALGVIRAAREEGKQIEVFADETRPRLQGMKLTAWELQQDGIPVTIIADNMAAVLMREGQVDCVVVGADRIAANGDTANKIGTYGLAVQAHFHNVPFYVAAPLSTVDFALPDGSHIPIEERDSTEMTHIENTRLAPDGVPVWNPAFDVTPAHLITAIITEQGIARMPYTNSLAALQNHSR